MIPKDQQTIVFVATRHHVEYIGQLLQAAGIDVSLIYGAMDQTARKISLGKFRYASLSERVCVCLPVPVCSLCRQEEHDEGAGGDGRRVAWY